MASFKSLNDLSLKSADGKSIVPAILQCLQNMQTQFNKAIEDMKESFMDVLRQKDEKIAELSGEIVLLKRQVERIEGRIDDNDQYERRDTLIISGESLPQCSSDDDCVEMVRQIAKDKLNYIVAASDISVAHRLGPKSTSQRPDRRKIIVKFCRRNLKVDLFAAARRVKPVNLFVNECLTAQRQSIFFALRKARKEFPNIVSGCSTIDGRVFAWLKSHDPQGTNSRDVRVLVNNLIKLDEFCQKNLKVPMTRFLQ